MGGRQEGISGTTIKDTWKKPRGSGIRGRGGDGWCGEGVVREKCRLVLYNN